MVSHPETGSDSPIGSDWYRGRDTWSSITFPKDPMCVERMTSSVYLGSDTPKLELNSPIWKKLTKKG